MNRPVKQGRARSDWTGFALPKHEKPRRGAAARYQMPDQPTEEYLQDFTERYCENTGLDCFHIPEIMMEVCFNPHRRVGGPDEAEDLRDAGDQIKGWPDCFIMDPKHPWHFLPLELKKPTGQLTKRQRDRCQAMQSRVPRSTQEIVDTIEAWRERLNAVNTCEPRDLMFLQWGTKE